MARSCRSVTASLTSEPMIPQIPHMFKVTCRSRDTRLQPVHVQPTGSNVIHAVSEQLDKPMEDLTYCLPYLWASADFDREISAFESLCDKAATMMRFQASATS